MPGSGARTFLAARRRSFEYRALHASVWARAGAIPVAAIVSFWVATRRRLLLGVIAAFVFGLVAVAVAISPRRLHAWSQRHPFLDAAYLGPLLFLGVATLTPLPIWSCVAAGFVGAAIGLLGAARRRRPVNPPQKEVLP